MNTELKTVVVGSMVLITINGKRKTLEIVEGKRSDIEQGKISVDAPVAQLILGAHAGETRRQILRGRKLVVTVEEVK